ncbi:hypothetical protein [Halanaerobium saccharolyticum]|uniref:hypothetical protein n=1 Tax=Halanaerobium saccharolyticum TaxID=43595 RepID=UPI000DB90156|nr:hypothetical protein [Halanaerobium saccharolyticum]
MIFNGKYFLDLNPTGDILAFICAIIFAIYSNLLKKTNNKSKQLFVIRKIFFYGIITMISAYIFLDEKINIFMIVGGILILFGVYLSDRQKF